ncbi:MAG TPA: hypothetical protein VL988_11185 [Solirubrobacteraceae bacterium]|nr:hypothetical protein [Solirubrobacteraceae bacterium]
MRLLRGTTASRTALAALSLLFPAIAAVSLLFPASAAALLELRFATPPALPALPAVTLNGKAQSDTTAMTPFAVEDTRLTKAGWNLTVEGQSGTGRSAAFAQYCPKAKCGADAEGYVAGGSTLAPGSLVLNSTGASFTGSLGTAPTLQCSTGCAIDSATPVKVASQGSGLLSGEGTWSTTGFSANSLALAAPTTMRALPNEEIYRVNVLWTLSTGP